jgi:hypothetical protein
MLMLYIEIFADFHAKHIKMHCGQNTEFVNVGAGGTYSKSGFKKLMSGCTEGQSGEDV